MSPGSPKLSGSVFELQSNTQEDTIFKITETTQEKSLSSWLKKESKLTNCFQFLRDLGEEPVQEGLRKDGAAGVIREGVPDIRNTLDSSLPAHISIWEARVTVIIQH